jgi:type IV pilus assembly protein PilW
MKLQISKRNSTINVGCRGFTLIEVLIALALTGLVMAAVYGIYLANIQAVVVDEQRVELQQGQRFGIDFMMRELRHAGYDLAESGNPTIVAAGSNYIYFTADHNNDGVLDDAGEHIVFCVYNDALGFKSLGYFATDSAANLNIAAMDGNNDGEAELTHTHSLPSHQAITTIEELEFNYHLLSGGQTTTPTQDGVDLDTIREIDISLLGRAVNADNKYTSAAQSFTTASGVVWAGFNDNFRRMLLVSSVRLRNMGL